MRAYCASLAVGVDGLTRHIRFKVRVHRPHSGRRLKSWLLSIDAMYVSEVDCFSTYQVIIFQVYGPLVSQDDQLTLACRSQQNGIAS